MLKAKLIDVAALTAARLPSHRFRREVVRNVMENDPLAVLHGVGPILNGGAMLDDMPRDLEPDGQLEFQHLAGMFASTSLNHRVAGLTIRESAYLFGLARRLGARRALEIGRWKGGSTLSIAGGMGRDGQLWSIDLGEKEDRLLGSVAHRPFDDQIRDFVERFGLRIELVVGDSRTLELDLDEVDLVFIDGDHSYEGVANDFERFGRRVRPGGAVLFHDAFCEEFFPSHTETVGRLVSEITRGADYELVNRVDRIAHVVRRS